MAQGGMIILKVLSECEGKAINTNEHIVADRIRKVVAEGKLESQGNLFRPRYSEVRLPSE